MAMPLVISATSDRTAQPAVTAPPPYALTPDAALVIMADGNGCVLDMNGKFFAIGPIGAALLQETLQNGPEAATARIAARYDVDTARVRADLDALLADMHRRGILLRGSDRGPRRGHAGARLAATIAHGLFRLMRGSRTRVVIALTATRLSFALFGWQATINAWKRHAPDPPPSHAPDRARALAREIDDLVRDTAPRLWFDIDCKERALTSQTLARHAGLPAELVIGVAFYPLAGHCWCEVETGTGPAETRTVISDDPANCNRYAPVFRYS